MSRYDDVSLGSLPAPDVIEELDYESYLSAGKAEFERLWALLLVENEELPSYEELSLESEPVTKFLEVLAYREMALRSRVNSGARAVMIGQSFGSNLDNLAAFFGVSRLDGETDAQLQRRTNLAPDALGGAGTEGGYLFHTYQAAPELKGAKAIIIESDHREVHVLPVSEEGDGTPSDDQLNRIRVKLSDEDVGLQTDVIVVRAPTVVQYTVTATLQVRPGPDSGAVLQAALQALQSYATERQQVGEQVYRSGVVSSLRVSPVLNVVTDFEDVVVPEDGSPYMVSSDITVEVVE